MFKEKDKSTGENPSRGPGIGMQNTKNAEKNVKKEAPDPGGSENVAGTGGKKNKNPDTIGSPPVNEEDLDLGNE